MVKILPDFSNRLIIWYLQNKRSLPWRETKDPYTIWLSEIILQQTRVAQGLPYYEKFLTTFPTVFDLANAGETEVLKLWQGLGYYSRARNLHYSAKQIAFKRNGNFPDSYDELITLKGVGDYTASAIASICYDKPTAVVDGNVYRVLSRVFGIETPINSNGGIKEFKQVAQELIDVDQPGIYNQAIMEFGARYCVPSKPDCTRCIFSDSCWALKERKVDQLPEKIKKSRSKVHYYNFLIPLTNDKRTLMLQRTRRGIWQNLFEFPLIDSAKKQSKNSLLIDVNYLKITRDWHVDEITLYNAEPILHKLSHKDLYVTFWILEVLKLPEEAIKYADVASLPVPVVLGRFISEFHPFHQ